MGKFKLLVVSFMLVIGVLAGCSADSENDQKSNTSNQQTESTENAASENEQKEEIVTISITKNKGAETVTEKEIEIEDGAILMDVMKENFEIVEKDGFITSVEGIKANESEKMFWSISVNGETAMKGANELKLAPGDTVSFDLQAWE